MLGRTRFWAFSTHLWIQETKKEMLEFEHMSPPNWLMDRLGAQLLDT